MTDRIFSAATRNRAHIIKGFYLVYLILSVVLVLGTHAIINRSPNQVFYLEVAPNLGQAALVVYILTVIPGIARRFGIKHKLISLLMIFRRYTGILMYILGFTHYMFLRGINTLVTMRPPDLILFEMFGFYALMLLTPMVLTSNDRAIRKLGEWWNRIHSLTYVIIFLIFLHVALQGVSIWSVLIGIAALLQLISHIYAHVTFD